MFPNWLAILTRKRPPARRRPGPTIPVRLEALEVREVMTFPVMWAPEMAANTPSVVVLEQSLAARYEAEGLNRLRDAVQAGGLMTAGVTTYLYGQPAADQVIVARAGDQLSGSGASVPPPAGFPQPTQLPSQPVPAVPQPVQAPGPGGYGGTPEPTPDPTPQPTPQPTAPAPEPPGSATPPQSTSPPPAPSQPTTRATPAVNPGGLSQSPATSPTAAAGVGGPSVLPTTGGLVGPPATSLDAPATGSLSTSATTHPIVAGATSPDQDGFRTKGGSSGAGLSAMSDGLLLRRFADTREQGAFTELVRRHGRSVHTVCTRVLGDPDQARDASQATFLALARRAGGLDVRDSLAGWLYRVAGRMALRVRTTSARQRRLERAVADQSPRDTTDTLGQLEAADSVQVLREELTRLPAKYRVPLELCYLDGRTHAEVAVAVGLPRGSVAKRIGEGLDRLRESLSVRGVLS